MQDCPRHPALSGATPGEMDAVALVLVRMIDGALEGTEVGDVGRLKWGLKIELVAEMVKVGWSGALQPRARGVPLHHGVVRLDELHQGRLRRKGAPRQGGEGSCR